MNDKKMFIKSLLSNKIFQFITSRYATYFIQFLNSIFIAVYLGPYYLGVWGFITLILQYINQVNFGIPHAANAIMSVNFNRKEYIEKIINSSLALTLILSILIGITFVLNIVFNINFGERYNFNIYLPVVIIIGAIAQFNALFSNVYRVYGRLFEVAFSQTIFPVLMLITIFIFNNHNLLWALVICNLISFLSALILFIVKSPIRLHFVFDLRLFKTIQNKGWYLFLYNTSFYLIIISTRTFISGNYTVKEFGYFTFAYSLSNAILLLLQSFSFLIFPKLINRMAYANNDKNAELLNQVRGLYVATSHLLIHIAILFYPLFIILFPEYGQTKTTFGLIALSIVLFTNSFGYSGLLISKYKEKLLSKLAMVSLVVNVLFAVVLINIFKVSYDLVIISTMISYFILVILLSYYGRKNLNLKIDITSLLKDVFPYNIFIPYFSGLIFILGSLKWQYYIIPLFLFLVLNFKNFIRLKSTILEIIKKPNIVNI